MVSSLNPHETYSKAFPWIICSGVRRGKYFTNQDFPEIAGDFPSKTLPFGGNRSCEVAIVSRNRLTTKTPSTHQERISFELLELLEYISQIEPRKSPLTFH